MCNNVIITFIDELIMNHSVFVCIDLQARLQRTAFHRLCASTPPVPVSPLFPGPHKWTTLSSSKGTGKHAVGQV